MLVSNLFPLVATQSEFRVVIFSVLEGLKSGFRVVALYLCWYLLSLAVRVQGSNILSLGRVKVWVQGSCCIFMLVSTWPCSQSSG